MKTTWQEFGNERTAEAYFAMVEACKNAKRWIETNTQGAGNSICIGIEQALKLAGE